MLVAEEAKGWRTETEAEQISNGQMLNGIAEVHTELLSAMACS